MSKLKHTKQEIIVGLLLVVCLWLAGGHVNAAAAQPAPDTPGDAYSEVFTNEMAEEIAAWVLEAYPELPFKEPQIEIHEDGIACSGVIEFFGIDVAASGRVAVFVENGKVNGRIEELNVAGLKVPAILMDAIDDVRSLYNDVTWEVDVTNVTLSEGELLIEGVYK